MNQRFTDDVFSHLAQGFGLAETNATELRVIADAIRGSLFTHQRNLIDDKHRRKAALCPRRAGKSFVAMAYAFIVCLTKPDARVVVMSVSLKTGKQNFWFEMAKMIADYGIPAKMYQNELRIQLTNGSMIWLGGADKRDAIEKLRGTQFDLTVIDECKSYPGFLLEELIKEVLNPTLRDRQGTMLLIGTPGSVLQGPFFEATYPGCTFKVGKGKAERERLFARDYYKPETYWQEHPGDRKYWSRHYWTVQDNVSKPHLWDEAMDEKSFNGWADDEPRWLREGLGQWAVSDDQFVYAYANLFSTDPDRVSWSPTPEDLGGNRWGLTPANDEWRYLLGVDLGYEDAFAMVVGAYNKHDGRLYHVWDYQQVHLDVTDCANQIKRVVERFGRIDAIVVDSGALGKQIAEEFRRRHGIPAKPADKTDKFMFIEYMNSDFRAGRVKIRPKSDLATQLSTLQLDLSSGQKKEELARAEKLRENRTQANHLCDAWLYLWRYSYHYFRKDRLTLSTPGTPEWQLEQVRAEQNAYAKQQLAERQRPAWSDWTQNRDPLADWRN